jgi:hypothetical protein
VPVLKATFEAFEDPFSQRVCEEHLASRDHAHGVHDIENSRSGPSGSMV